MHPFASASPSTAAGTNQPAGGDVNVKVVFSLFKISVSLSETLTEDFAVPSPKSPNLSGGTVIDTTVS